MISIRSSVQIQYKYFVVVKMNVGGRNNGSRNTRRSLAYVFLRAPVFSFE